MEEWLECEVEYEVLFDGISVFRGITDSEKVAYQEAEDFIDMDSYGRSFTRDDYEIRIL